jgi:hypothetical protein
MPINLGGNTLNSLGTKLLNDTSIVTTGSVLYVDAGIATSYGGSGTTWTDLTTNSNNGTLTNGPTYNAGSGGSILFDGTDDYVSINNSTSLQVADTFTISAWIYPNILSNRFTVFSTRRLNTAGSWQLEVGTGSGGTGRVVITGVGTFMAESINDVITSNVWSNICFVKPNNATQGGIIYVNGVSVSLFGTLPYTILNNPDEKLIGCGTNIGLFFPGRISNVCLYNRVLSAQEVLQNHQSQRQRFGV